MKKVPKIQRFSADKKIARKLEEDDRNTYISFIDNLNIGLFQAETDDLHQVMNQLVLATKDASALIAEPFPYHSDIWNLLDGDTDEKLTRYIGRTVDRFLGEAENLADATRFKKVK